MSILSDELTNDPLTRGYAGMTDAQAAADLNTAYRNVVKTSLSGDDLFGATDSTEFNGLSDLNKQLWVAFCGRDSIDPFGSANVAFVQFIFGGGSTTVSALSALRTIANGQTRAQELGIRVTTDLVAAARA